MATQEKAPWTATQEELDRNQALIKLVLALQNTGRLDDAAKCVGGCSTSTDITLTLIG